MQISDKKLSRQKSRAGLVKIYYWTDLHEDLCFSDIRLIKNNRNNKQFLYIPKK